MSDKRMRESLIIALDTDAHTALGIARSLVGKVGWVKVGMTLFYAEGPRIVAQLKDMGFDVFVDLKLHDIPHQVEGAAREVARLGAGMFTVHASGGREMMEAAVRGACDGSAECGIDAPSVLAVTVLTSMADADLAEIGVHASAESQVRALGTLALQAGVQGVVCSPQEAAMMRSLLGSERLVVTPGVRPRWAALGDQSRVATPHDALQAGASHLVIGRPVTAQPNPATVVERIVEEG